MTTTHVWEGQNIALELDANGEVSNRYIRGTGLICSDKNGWYLFNGHGDVAQLADNAGAVTKEYAYDAFGNEKNVDDADTNPFRYSGEYYDKETGEIYLKARYYNPSVGRFNSADSYLGNNTDPLSLNLYTYCYNNPVIFIDPSGHIGIKSDGTIYMAEGDTKIDKKLLQLKIAYSKPGADKKAIAARASKLRADNPNSWHVSADKSLDYYTVTEITDKLNKTMEDAESTYCGYSLSPIPMDFVAFYSLVRNGGPYDLKNQQGWQHEQFMYDGEIIDKDAPGNICYGYLGKSMGFEDVTLRAGAGFAQRRAGTSKKEWQNFNTFGDDPRDTARINQGIQIYKNTHPRILW